MEYSDIGNPQIKAIIDNLKHQSHTVMTDIQQALEEAETEAEFIEDAMANMDNLHNEILEINNQIRQAGEAHQSMEAQILFPGDLKRIEYSIVSNMLGSDQAAELIEIAGRMATKGMAPVDILRKYDPQGG